MAVHIHANRCRYVYACSRPPMSCKRTAPRPHRVSRAMADTGHAGQLPDRLPGCSPATSSSSPGPCHGRLATCLAFAPPAPAPLHELAGNGAERSNPLQHWD